MVCLFIHWCLLSPANCSISGALRSLRPQRSWTYMECMGSQAPGFWRSTCSSSRNAPRQGPVQWTTLRHLWHLH
ncbi:hypothetical protein FB451DRAFT_512068 [Mycena latifolia]|nr:hypothetical protein FB451DRAFT_512068 [Mycena latifolia]